MGTFQNNLDTVQLRQNYESSESCKQSTWHPTPFDHFCRDLQDSCKLQTKSLETMFHNRFVLLLQVKQELFYKDQNKYDLVSSRLL
ncbi:hypothetical protein RRG08_025248 [Elysia crispata]|uniref:Uncharacterized protein n=1 Tax=Elysia crispata TaxID=231223 RepID=A0AAE1AA12_9GAST|nr:hypothetical protein RRG08_025248 [Elysia crispata]